MRVFVESDMTVCPDGHTLNLRAGQTLEGPLARYLADSNCDVTIEEDDRAPVVTEDTAEPDVTSHVPGSGSAEQEAVPEQETAPDPAPEAAEPAVTEPDAAV